LTLKNAILLVAVLLTVFTATAQNYNNIEFVENKGQWNSRVKFKAEFSTGAIFVHDGGFTILQHNPQDFERVREMLHGHSQPSNETIILRSHAFNVDFANVSPDMKLVADKMIPTYNNYIVGNDPSKWESNCRIFQALTMENVYPNIDVRYYTNNGVLKYDIIVKPGADISRIALRYQGVDRLQVKNKELAISTSVGELKESTPYTYQVNDKGRQEVFCKYVVKDNLVKFDVRGYDPTTTLVIDPSMVYCSFSGSTADNWGYTATYGPDGSTFGGGIVFGNGFPVTSGAFQTSFQGGNGSPPGDAPIDIGIIKLSPTGNARIYATYIGGSGNELPHSLVVDNQGNVTLAGRTNSPLSGTGAYPVTGGSSGIIGNTTTMADWDIIITKLNATGTGLVGSKRIGGAGMDGGNITAGNVGPANSLNRNYGDASRSEVIQDASGNIYVASCTQSSDFPIRGTAFQSTLGGAQDGVVIKFDPTISTCLFSSFLGGSANDAAYVLSIGPAGDIFVAGGTESNAGSFPGNHAGTVGPVNNGNVDGFIAQVSNNGATLIRTTFIGTSGNDQIYGIQFDRNGYPYIMGQTTGTWQIRNALYGNGNAKQFIAKLERDLSNYIYSTAFGPNSTIPNISPVAFLVDRCENVYVSGWGGSLSGYQSGGTTGMPITSDAYQSTTDGEDFYFFVLKKNATDILYGSYFGIAGGLPDHVDGGTSRFDQNGVIYQGICASCTQLSGFPTTSNAWARVKPASASCNLAMVKIEFNLAGVGAGVQSSINGVPRDTAGCVPLTVDFTDTIANAVSYEWHFNYVPGNPPDLTTTVPNASWTYTAVGLYTVMLVAIDPNTCNVRDSSFTRIRVGDLRATVDWMETKLLPCDSFKYRFDNLSVAPAIRPFGPQSFIWDFGDGSPRVVSGPGPVFHNFPGQGTYNVTLLLQDTAYCNTPDSLTRPVSVAENVIADFDTDSIGCVPHTAVFVNETIAGQTFQWDFGDGNTSTASSPTHIYTAAGLYRVRLIANNPNTCNGSDTAFFDIRVHDIPVADFSWGPNPPVVNTAVTFNNNSSLNAVSFQWNFGDGDTLFTTSRLPVQHLYNATGRFNVCLIAYNAQGCPDTVCQEVSALIVPAIDVPNAFTPQSGDINSIVMPRGFGISKLQFTIWNRWGQKVFETDSRNQGWDGKVKGVVQPMDVYAYTLYVEFFDGTKATKTGDVTLIR